MRISLKDMQGFGVAFPVEQVDSGVQSYKFGVGLCLKEYFDITRITKFREEMPFHIVVGPTLIQPHKQAQAAYFLSCIPHRSGVYDIQYLLLLGHFAVCNQPAQEIPCHTVIAHFKERSRK